MFKDLLIKWVTDLIDKFAAVGQNSYLSIGLSAFNNTLYGWVHTIMTSVVMPIAYVILALFSCWNFTRQVSKLMELAAVLPLELKLCFV